jgi:Tfp pilus assembly protein PilF
VILVYGRVADYEFVSLDDPGYVFDNPEVRRGLTWDGAQWAFATLHKSNWHPLTWLSHMLDCQLFGVVPGGPHVINVILHAINGVLLFLVLRWMTGALWPCALVAALFALHPLRVESVAWVAERKDVLSGFFWMTTILAYVSYARHASLLRYLLVFTSLALGLMAKPMLVTLPCVLLLLDVWPLGRWQLTHGPDRADARSTQRAVRIRAAPIHRLVLEKLPLLGLSAASGVLTVFAGRSKGAVATLEDLPFWSRMANALVAYVAYLGKTVWPTDLAVFYPHPALVSTEAASSLVVPAIGAALLLVMISLVMLYMATRRPYLAVGWFWYLGTLVPVIGLLQVGFQGMADRYSYLPLVGIYIVIAWGGRDLALRWPRSRPILIAAAGISLTICVTATWLQVGTWRNSITLFERAIQVTENNYFAHGNLASVLAALGRLDEATVHYEDALRIRPSYPTALAGLGSVYFRQGKLEQAAAQLRRALRVEPDSPVVLANLGAVLFRQGKLVEAASHLEHTLRVRPDYAMAHTNLGAVYFRQGDLDQAAAHFERSLQLEPNSAKAHSNLGAVLLEQGRLLEAAAQFEQALSIQPNLASARQNLQLVRARLGDIQ